jgi:uncharacterized OB-fold protein
MADREFVGASFYRFLDEMKLVGSRCGSCGALHVPPRAMCPVCYSDEVSWEEMSGDGELVAYTTIHIAPTAMIEAGYDRKNPYCTGIVQLAEGPAISGQILGVDPGWPEQIEIGTALRVVFVRRGEGEQARTYLAFEAAS